MTILVLGNDSEFEIIFKIYYSIRHKPSLFVFRLVEKCQKASSKGHDGRDPGYNRVDLCYKIFQFDKRQLLITQVYITTIN